MATSIVDSIISILNKDTLTARDRTEVANMTKDLDPDEFSFIFDYAQDVLAARFENGQDPNVISDIIADLQGPPPTIANTRTMYKGIKEENKNTENLPSGLPGNSTTVRPNSRFVPRITKSTYIQEPPKPMRRLKGTPKRGNTLKYLSKRGGKRKKTSKTRRRQRKY